MRRGLARANRAQPLIGEIYGSGTGSGRDGLLVTAHAQRGMWMCDRRPMSIHEVAASGVAARRTEMCAYTVVYTAVGALASTRDSVACERGDKPWKL